MIHTYEEIGRKIVGSWGYNTEKTISELITHFGRSDQKNQEPIILCLLATIAKQSIETNKLLRKLDKRLLPLEKASKNAIAAGKARERQVQVDELV